MPEEKNSAMLYFYCSYVYIEGEEGGHGYKNTKVCKRREEEEGKRKSVICNIINKSKNFTAQPTSWYNGKKAARRMSW